jgi:glycosyltransferase involved in cell wall biosynthesis
MGIRNNGPVVGMISCLKPQKAPLDYIKACVKIYKEMSDVNFLIVGDGILRKRCEKLLAGSCMNGNFILTGWRRDVPEILDILDVAVLTSKWEGMPITLIEALSKGCPVVATNIGGSNELIEEGVTGCLVRPGAHKEISEKVLGILKDPDVRAAMRKKASLSIDDSFALERMAGEIEYLYGRLL